MSVFNEENLTPLQRSMRELVSESRGKRSEIDQKMINSTRGVDGANLQNSHEPPKDQQKFENQDSELKAQNEEDKKEMELKVNDVVLRWNRISKESDIEEGSLKDSDGFGSASVQEAHKGKIRRAGRPRLNKEDKAKRVSVFFSPNELQEIDKKALKDKGGRPRRSAHVRSRLRRLKDFEKRELRQMKLLKNLINQMNELIEKTLENDEALYAEGSRSKLKLEGLSKKAHEIEMVFNIVQFDQRSLDQGLGKKEMQGLRFAMELAQKGI